ncbi:MAG: RnfABCDGE type electron transport complex subunit B [Buchnera aphidicola (Nurudea shiraii)]
MMALIIYSISFFGILSLFLGFLLKYISEKFKINSNPIVEKIEKLLPQTQCSQCDYPGCYAYANAIGNNNEKIDKCIPGGSEVTLNIANLLGYDESEYNSIGIFESVYPNIVVIDENNCVGCSKCRLICPVDAVVGSYNLMHTILPKICTGCNLCISLCPTNCIKEKTVIYDYIS